MSACACVLLCCPDGAGYLTALFAEFVKPGGTVVGIDHIPELVDMSRENFKKDGRAKMLDAGQVVLVAGDGRMGYEVRRWYSKLRTRLTP